MEDYKSRRNPKSLTKVKKLPTTPRCRCQKEFCKTCFPPRNRTFDKPVVMRDLRAELKLNKNGKPLNVRGLESATSCDECLDKLNGEFSEEEDYESEDETLSAEEDENEDGGEGGSRDGKQEDENGDGDNEREVAGEGEPSQEESEDGWRTLLFDATLEETGDAQLAWELASKAVLQD
jgi:hypothetical protein